jgi:hypothetical protein
MNKSDEFHARAQECEQRAAQSIDPRIEGIFLELAYQWRDLARQWHDIAEQREQLGIEQPRIIRATQKRTNRGVKYPT